MKIVNLTPHKITMKRTVRQFSGMESVLQIPSSGIARCSGSSTVAATVEGVTFYTSTYGEIEGLPAPVAGTILIVSRMAMAACPTRLDLACPIRLVRDDQGRITGCEGIEVQPGAAEYLAAIEAAAAASRSADTSAEHSAAAASTKTAWAGLAQASRSDADLEAAAATAAAKQAAEERQAADLAATSAAVAAYQAETDRQLALATELAREYDAATRSATAQSSYATCGFTKGFQRILTKNGIDVWRIQPKDTSADDVHGGGYSKVE